jgi:hypothetical protein
MHKSQKWKKYYTALDENLKLLNSPVVEKKTNPDFTKKFGYGNFIKLDRLAYRAAF